MFNIKKLSLILFFIFLLTLSIDAKRSKQWSKIRKAHLKTHSVCAVCEGKEGLQVHHIRTFKLHPELELDKNNLITLCTNKQFNCHLKIGHGGNYRWENPDIHKHIEWIKKCNGNLACMKSVARHIKKLTKEKIKNV